MKNRLYSALALAACLVFAQVEKAAAWGMTGHRVIAEIAERHLNKKAKKNNPKDHWQSKVSVLVQLGRFH
ncbi:hypothetical protein [Sphingobacterium sp. T2]|uniref:hypothetical protein n=1 Tax=Sphingobacterium sp. T2 TaxID=1590596 RepID=UPI000AC4DA9C|nr:hypothetical protein [Sphingobacterium sp. T2]